MATWSRSQAQEAGGQRAISSGIKTKCSTHLARCERIRLANKRENARIVRWAEEAPTYKKVREYNNTIVVKLSRKAKRALNGRVMSAANHAKLAAKANAREAFFRAIEAGI